MSEPISFTSSTMRFGIPLLFSGQAQKEFYVNEAHNLLDAVIHPNILGVGAVPPVSPAEGEMWLVANAAQDAWALQDNKIALYQSGAWIFVEPIPGMRVFDTGTGQFWLFDMEWVMADAPEIPQGGTSIDAEARNAIAELIEVLRKSGILPRN